MAKSFLRWVGGKKDFVESLAPRISNYLNRTKGTYYEPFLGGGAMALGLGLPKMVLGDVLPDLIKTYTSLRDSPVELASLVHELGQWGSDENHYYAIRDTEPETDIEAGARMIYLNAHCFNGLWRMNKRGEMNAAYGKQKDRITDALIERIGAAAEAIKGAEIHCSDFEPLIKKAKQGDLIYADPPYDGTYVGYSGDGFCGTSQERLAAELYYAHQRGVTFITHNADTELVRYWYSEFATLVTSKERRAVNRDGEGRGKKECLLISNRPELLP